MLICRASFFKTNLTLLWTGTLGAEDTDVLPSIMAIFWSELFITPVLRLIDIVGNIKKHILAPRTRTQEQMNSNFTGTFYNLGERYVGHDDGPCPIRKLVNTKSALTLKKDTRSFPKFYSFAFSMRHCCHLLLFLVLPF